MFPFNKPKDPIDLFFELVEDKDISKNDRKRLMNWLVKDLFRMVNQEDVLRVVTPTESTLEGINPGIYYKGKILDRDSMASLQGEAEKWDKSVFWKMLSNELKYKSGQRMFYASKSEDDLMGGKMGLWVIEVIEQKLKEIARLTGLGE